MKRAIAPLGCRVTIPSPPQRLRGSSSQKINKQMPFIGGDNLIHVTKLDYIVPVDRPLVELPLAPIGPVEQRIGELCAELIHDGDTLQIGIGAIPDAVLQSLRERKDLACTRRCSPMALCT